MPSIAHETPMELIRQYPPLILELLRSVSDLKLDTGIRVRLVSADASVVVPAQYLADGVALAEDENGNPLLAVVIESQGRDARTKEYSWPVYVCSVRSERKCDTLLLVICWNPDEVEECQQIIRTGHPGFDLAPVVAHPGNTLCRDGGVTETAGPYLILFAGYIGAIDLHSEAGQDMMLDAARQVPVGDRRSCIALIMTRASEAARHAMEAKMATPAYRSDYLTPYIAQTLVSAVLEVLKVRGIALTKDRAEQVEACTDVDRLQAWHHAAITAETSDDVFGS